jgi:hypothetical protein
MAKTTPKARTLKFQIFMLIEKYGLPEVLDRLADLVDEQSRLKPNHSRSQAWDDLTTHLERATHQSLEIASVNEECGLWS